MDPVRDMVIEQTARWVEIARKVAIARAGVPGSGLYPDASLGYRLTPQGIELQALENDPYDDSTSAAGVPVTWEDIDNHTTLIPQLEAAAKEYKEKAEKQRVEWERKQYETLKAKFEGK